MQMRILAVFAMLVWDVTVVHTACTFPSDLTGDWYSTLHGTLTFNSTSFSGYTSSISPGLTFTCNDSSGTQYLVQSTYVLFGFNVYLCMDLKMVTAVKYVVRLDNNFDASYGERFYLGDPATITFAEGCTRTDTRSGGEFELFFKKDNLSDALTACPGALQSQFRVEINSSAVANCSNTTLDGQQSGLLVYNYSSCVNGMFNKGGILQCLYSTVSDYTYVTLYNNDTTVNGASTYRFTCMVLSKSASELTASEYPEQCHNGQTPSSVNAPGILYDMVDLLYSEDTSNNNNVLIIVLCTIGGAIVIAVIVIVLYLKVFRKKDEIPKIRKVKSKISITDYTPRMDRTSSLEKGVNLVNKQSSVEVLTGIMEGKKNKKVMGDAYEPPKKEKWQKKWEKSPRLDSSLKESNRKYPSDGSVLAVYIPTHELDKAYTVASSLPESIDLPEMTQETKNRRLDEGIPVHSTRLGVLEKSHASPKIPRSTGKFGGSPNSYQFSEDGFYSPPEPRLDTITENPLSRENTRTHVSSGLSKTLREHPDMITGLKNRGTLSMSTASAWQIKWETTMRPKTPSPILTKKCRRSKTPVKLFQHTFDYSKLYDKPTDTSKPMSIDSGNHGKPVPAYNIPNEVTESVDKEVIDIESKTKDEIHAAVDAVKETAKPETVLLATTQHDDDVCDHSPDIRHVTVHSPVDVINDNDLISFGSTLSRDSELDIAAPSALNVSGVTMEVNDGDSISLHAELFFPSDWLYDDDFQLEDIWRQGARSVNSKRKREFKQFLAVEHDRIAGNEKSTTNYAKSVFNERKRRVLKRKC